MGLKPKAWWRPGIHWLLAAGLGLAACTPDREAAPEVDLSAAPLDFPEPVYQYQDNPVTKEGLELGRKLFYDPMLSKDGTISCGSCHKQFAAFADLEHPVSHGIDGKLGTRNAPALVNLRWNPGFFWDGGVNHLELVPLAPITNPVEMGEELSHVIRKLNRDPKYVLAFKQVFHQDSINSQQLLRALAQFMGELVSAHAPYDQYRNGEKEALSADQQQGLLVFEAKCSTCHKPGLFTDHSFRNNGLEATFSKDAGRNHITESPADLGKFKVPSLRNVALTSPYMHDGRFWTLQQVLEHYNSGVKRSATLDPVLDGTNPGIPLTETEKAQLITFLEALTDRAFINNKRFSETQ
jgi:cytochrome c peroxidase